MAAATKWYGKALLNVLGGELEAESYSVDLLSDTIKVALFTSSYTPNQDSDELFSALSNEVSASGTNYTAGGVTLTNKTLTYYASANRTVFDADNAVWTSASFTAAYAVIYKATNSVLLGYVDFSGSVTVTAGTFTIDWGSNGILSFYAT